VIGSGELNWTFQPHILLIIYKEGYAFENLGVFLKKSAEKQVEWERIARRRLRSVLERHTIATLRTLEQKISDAGPNNQRVNPHILTTALKKMQKKEIILKKFHSNETITPWYYLPTTQEEKVSQRLEQQLPILKEIHKEATKRRIGETLEIAVFRALLKQKDHEFLGAFSDIDNPDKNQRYSKEDPPKYLNGKSIQGKKKLDFLIRHPEAGWAGIEIKNVREWLYPNRKEIKDLILKSVSLDVVPVLICRRIPYVSFLILSQCGVIVHETYNQLYSEFDRELAMKAKQKDLLGFR
jgi:hypothetical protein